MLFYHLGREVCRPNSTQPIMWSKNTHSEVGRVLLIEIDSQVYFDRLLVSVEIPPQQPCVKPLARPERQA